MTVADFAHRSARRAAGSGVLETLTRAGFIGYGLLHLAVAWLAGQIALGQSGEQGDQAGAFRTLADQPFGKVLLIAIAVGLVAMAVWQLLLAAIGHRAEHGRSRTAERVASAARVVIYAALAWTAIKVVSGAGASSADQQQGATAGLMGRPAGQWLVALAGLTIIAIGVGMAIYGFREKFWKKLNTGRMSPRTRTIAGRLGQIGYIAKGLALTIVGVLMVNAAVTHDPAKSRGLDSALRTLVEQPFGVFLLLLVAAGLAAFGVYCFVQARYRKVSA